MVWWFFRFERPEFRFMWRSDVACVQSNIDFMAPGKKSETPVYTGRTQISRLKGWSLSDKRRGQVVQMHETLKSISCASCTCFFVAFTSDGCQMSSSSMSMTMRNRQWICMSIMHMSHERQVDGGSWVDGRDLQLSAIYVKVHVCNSVGLPVLEFSTWSVSVMSDNVPIKFACVHFNVTACTSQNMSRCLSASTALSVLACLPLFMTASVAVVVYWEMPEWMAWLRSVYSRLLSK